MTFSYSTKTKIWFLGAGILVLLALYCFAGACMNGSFAVGGGTSAELERFHRGAVLFFWSAAALAGGALICLVLGVVHFRRRHRAR